jgi:hypothetical protein
LQHKSHYASHCAATMWNGHRQRGNSRWASLSLHDSALPFRFSPFALRIEFFD